MHVVLISPRLVVQKNDFLGSGIPYWPTELAILASRLRKLGYFVSFVDLFGSAPSNFQNYGKYYLQGYPIEHEKFSKTLESADIFILYALHYSCHTELLRILRFLKGKYTERTKAILENGQAVTGYSIKIFSDQFLSSGANILIKSQDFIDWNKVFTKNFMNNNEGIRVVDPDKKILQNYRKSKKFKRPFPAWDLVNLKAYWSIPYSHGPKQKKYLPIISSTGCPFGCDFCVIPEASDRMWLGRDPQDVVDEILFFKNRYKVKNFHFEDLNPTVQAKRFENICEDLIKRNANIHFYIVSGTKAETINTDQLPMIANSGCKYISISPETGSSVLMKRIGKPFDHQKAKKLIKEAKRYKIRTQACFLVAHPNETNEDYLLTKKYLKELILAGLDEVAVFIVAPFAGSSLYNQGAIETGEEGWLPSFTPNNRKDIVLAKKRRSELIKLFFLYKLINSFSIWGQGYRALFSTPQTKMENLPKRFIFVKYNMFFSEKGN